MESIHSPQEESVVQRWLKKLIVANDEWDKDFGLGKYKKPEKVRKPYQRKPKPEPKSEPKKKTPAAQPEQDRRKEAELARRNFKQSKEKGFVYLMKSGNGYYKIGISKNAGSRLYGLRRQFPVEIDIVHKIASNNYRNVEKFLHRKYAHRKAELEWFKLEPEDIRWLTALQDGELDWVLGD